MSQSNFPLRRMIAGAALGAGLLLGGAAAASATAPIPLGDSFVTDHVDVLTDGEERAANSRLADAHDATGVDLYVVLVDEFTDPSDRIEWADQVAVQNGLGANQYLLAISTEGRQYFISADNDGPLSESQISGIEEAILPDLRDSDWAGAITSAAESLETEDAAPGKNTAIAVGTVVGGLGVAGAGYGIWRANKRRRTERETEEELQELTRTAGAGLVAADDAVKTAEQELEFARAQFGEPTTAEFQTALQSAKERLVEAFGLQQKLDDGVPDKDEDRRAWLGRIVELCASIDADLAAQADSLRQLRDIEKDAPGALAALEQRLAAADADGAQAEAELQRLRGVFAADAISAVAQNPEQAAQLLVFARERAQGARAAVEAGRTGDAALAIHEAEGAVQQSGELRRALAELGPQLDEVASRAEALVADIQGDIDASRAMPDADGRIAAAASAAAQEISRARVDLGAAERHPSRALQALEAANASIDGVLESAREAERARQVLDGTLARVSSLVSQTEQFIASRRGAIGPTARTRISEARASLAQAEAARVQAPQAALSEAQRAERLANDAYQAAQSDVSGWGGGGGSWGPGTGGGNSDLSAILGGIIGGQIGSSWGRSSGGSWGGGGGWGGGGRSGGRSGGGFSGGGRRSSGGGRF